MGFPGGSDGKDSAISTWDYKFCWYKGYMANNSFTNKTDVTLNCKFHIATWFSQNTFIDFCQNFEFILKSQLLNRCISNRVVG